MVRRQAANNLAKFVKEMQSDVVIDEIIPLFQYLASDDQDSVRLLTVDILIAIAEEIPKEQQPSHGVLLTSLRSLFEDKSWRVRYMVADRYEKVHLPKSEYLGKTDVCRSLKLSMKRLSPATWCLPLLSFSKIQRPKFALRLLVKFPVCYFATCVADNWLTHSGFCHLIDRDTLLNEIMTSVEDLVSDPSQHVRASLGTQISGLAPILGKEE